nr:hypothetical protein [uncultured Allomuricauda sp.]
MKKELVVKRNGFEGIDDLVGHLLSTKSDIDSLIKLLQTNHKSLENKILVRYIVTQSAGKTCEFINGKGYKTANGKKFYPKDVSELIKSGVGNVDPSLLDLSRQIFDKNWKGVSRRYN